MKAGRKITGGKYKRPKKKKKYERSGQPRVVKLGEKRVKKIRTRGGKEKTVAFSHNEINLIVRGKAKKTKIKNVLQTPSNTFLARQNILLKGAIVETELGKAKITNRPSQEGHVQGILIE